MPTLAVVINPSKFEDLADPKRVVETAAEESGWQVTWYETTEADPGLGQAKQALGDAADVVASLGGDGTVRHVATALAGTGTPLGLLPGGTGNLLARNLGLPVDDLDAAVRVVLSGTDRHVDVGRITFDDGEPELFCVMAGMGLDADTMAGTNEDLKAKVGWAAYLLAGLRSLVGNGFGIALLTPGRWPVIQHARSVVVGNCGTLTGDIELMPDAQLDDGVLDVVVVSPGGVFGWVAVLAAVLTRQRAGHQRLVRRQDARLEAMLDRKVAAQTDGDAIGEHQRFVAEIDPGALVVRVP